MNCRVTPRVETGRHKASTSLRLAIGEFRILMHPGKVIIERLPTDRYPHLTLAWYPQGLVDLHLTYGHVASTLGVSEKIYSALGTLDSSDLARLSEYLKAWSERVAVAFVGLWRPMNPGWLRRNGYDVILPDEQRFAELARICAPKSRGKFRVNFEELSDTQNWSEMVRESAYDPVVLHLLDHRAFHMPLMAISPKGAVVLLIKTGRSPRGRWLGCKQRDAARAFRREVGRLLKDIAGLVNARHAESFELIVRELGLEEPTNFTEHVKDLRLFFSEPHAFVEKRLRHS